MKSDINLAQKECSCGFIIKLEGWIRESLLANHVPFKKIETNIGQRLATENRHADFPAIKIVAFFQDDANRILDLLSSEFEVQALAPVHQGRQGQHSYSSAPSHFIARLNRNGKASLGSHAFADCSFEIVVSTVLQEAFEDIQKELSDSTAGINGDAKSELEKIKSLIGMADSECSKISHIMGHSGFSGANLNSVDANNVHIGYNDLQEGFMKDETIVALNAPVVDETLEKYVLNSRIVAEIDAEIAQRVHAAINADVDVEGDAGRLAFSNILTIGQLSEALVEKRKDVVAFAEKWIGNDTGGSFDKGICLFYLEYLLVGETNDLSRANEYVTRFISDNDYNARRIIQKYAEIKNAGVEKLTPELA